MSLDTIIERCLHLGIGCVAISDHDEVQGGIELQKIAPFSVIVAEEILTPVGEIMGMFLTERIPSGVSPYEAIAQIRSQGGLVCLPHPFDRVRPATLSHGFPDELFSEIDIIEVFNARTLNESYCEKARIFAAERGLLRSAGSDAHTSREIGNAYIEIPEFDSKEEFLSSLAQGEVFGHKSGMWVHIPSMFNRIKSKIKK